MSEEPYGQKCDHRETFYAGDMVFVCANKKCNHVFNYEESDTLARQNLGISKKAPYWENPEEYNKVKEAVTSVPKAEKPKVALVPRGQGVKVVDAQNPPKLTKKQEKAKEEHADLFSFG